MNRWTLPAIIFLAAAFSGIAFPAKAAPIIKETLPIIGPVELKASYLAYQIKNFGTEPYNGTIEDSFHWTRDVYCDEQNVNRCIFAAFDQLSINWPQNPSLLDPWWHWQEPGGPWGGYIVDTLYNEWGCPDGTTGFGSCGGGFTDLITFNYRAVPKHLPEPSPLALLGLGLVALALRRK